MLGNTAIVTAKHSASDVLCHRIRQSSSLTGATLLQQHDPFSRKASGTWTPSSPDRGKMSSTVRLVSHSHMWTDLALLSQVVTDIAPM